MEHKTVDEGAVCCERALEIIPLTNQAELMK